LHASLATAIAAAIVAIARLIAYAIDDDKRWPRFRNLALFVVFVALGVAAGWWLLVGGGMQALTHDFGSVDITAFRQ
jgi:uncharacterized membrane protein YqjE